MQGLPKYFHKCHLIITIYLGYCIIILIFRHGETKESKQLNMLALVTEPLTGRPRI